MLKNTCSKVTKANCFGGTPVSPGRQSVERGICWYGQNWHKALTLTFKDISIETAIFIATKHEKTNMVVSQICIIISSTLTFLPEI